MIIFLPDQNGFKLYWKGYVLFFGYLQGYEDWLRHNSDNEVNGAPVYVVQSGGLVKTRSKNIRVCI